MGLFDNSHIFPNDLNPIMNYNSSHSSHDEDDDLRFPPLQVDNISSEFDKLETWLAQ